VAADCIRHAPSTPFTSAYLGTSPGFWLRLQLDYELMRAEREKGERISREVQRTRLKMPEM
jgi:plasmid maintenance system antidote protein VapI